MEDRHGTRSTVITSQPPVSQWHDYLEDPSLADAILGRLVHCAHKLELKREESMRKARGSLTEDEHLR